MTRILVTGANGQLGYSIKKISGDFPDAEFHFCTRDELDLSCDTSIREKIKNIAPDVVINAAAYTNVDLAESEKEMAFRINGAAVGVIAEVCELIGAKLIQISTDYVFDGKRNEPYPVDFPTSPINTYGASKLEGEIQALSKCSQSCVIRTSSLYSERGRNFATTMQRLFQTHSELRVVNDQSSCPTHAKDLGLHCVQVSLTDPFPVGIHHFCGLEVMSWYQFALKLLKEFEGDTKTQVIHAISSEKFGAAAKRPQYSVLEIA